MKRILFSVCMLLLFAANHASAQCTPVNCSASLPPYGGICDTMLINGRVNQAYSDFESFVITSNCFDAGLISPPNAGTNVRITNVDNFTYTLMPSGISAASNQSSYSPPNPGNIAGCVRFQGTPTQIGVFRPTVNFLADVIVCGLPIPVNNNAASYALYMTVLPDPTFTGLASTYCSNAAPVTLTVTGTTGGTFSGPGITGSTFNPATAGAGTHTIKYKVSRQEGSAVAAATDSMMVTVTVTAPSFTYYLDNDNDGYGVIGTTISSCSSSAPAGYAPVSGDCNDNVSAINPGSAEVCDNIDNNCNVQIDEGLPLVTYYEDSDNDGYGNPAVITTACVGLQPSGYVTNDLDCDDGNNAINPGAVEIPNNSIDENCDGSLGVIDNDGDGFASDVDCNDNNTQVYPGAPEICDGLDNDCDGFIDLLDANSGLTVYTYYVDADNDNYGTSSSITSCQSTAPAGYAAASGDCNDNNNAIHPGATEICDGIDNDCDGGIDLLDLDANLQSFTYFIDADDDGYGGGAVTISCSATPPNGYVANNTDCDDSNDAIHPGATEVCDGLDNDCTGGADNGLQTYTYYYDGDNDGYGNSSVDSVSCSVNTPVNYVLIGGDCDDANADRFPNNPEVCDGIDNDCAGGIDDGLSLNTYYRDFDTDGYGDATDDSSSCSLTPPAGYVANNTDCNDADLGTNPGATEIPNNGIDEDCNGSDLIIGLNTVEAQFGVTLFPNPANEFIVLSGKLNEDMVVTIYDLQGKQLLTRAMVQGQNYMLDISSLKAGYYMLEVTNKATALRGNSRIVVVK